MSGGYADLRHHGAAHGSRWRPDMACRAVHEASPLCGMAAMYLLMSAFHAAPWLRLISGRRSGAERS